MGTRSDRGTALLTVLVRPVRPGEGLAWKELRLRALADSPDAFATTHASQLTRPDADWHQMVDAAAEATDEVLLVAEVDSQLAGMARCGVTEGELVTGNIYSMWVDPDFRRCGAGRALLLGAFDWLEQHSATVAELDVTETNTDAIALYTALGFTFTGDTEPLRAGSSLKIATMRRSLSREPGRT